MANQEIDKKLPTWLKAMIGLWVLTILFFWFFTDDPFGWIYNHVEKPQMAGNYNIFWTYFWCSFAGVAITLVIYGFLRSENIISVTNAEKERKKRIKAMEDELKNKQK